MTNYEVVNWKDNGFIVKAFVDGAEVGLIRMMLLWEEHPDYIFVDDVRVHGDFQRRGIGTQLYIAAITEAKKRGFRYFASGAPRSTEADRAWDRLRKLYSVRKLPILGGSTDGIDLTTSKTAAGRRFDDYLKANGFSVIEDRPGFRSYGKDFEQGGWVVGFTPQGNAAYRDGESAEHSFDTVAELDHILRNTRYIEASKTAADRAEQLLTNLDGYDLTEVAEAMPPDELTQYRNILLRRKMDPEYLCMVASYCATPWPEFEKGVERNLAQLTEGCMDYIILYTLKVKKQRWEAIEPSLPKLAHMDLVESYDQQFGTALVDSATPDMWLDRSVREWTAALQTAVSTGKPNPSLERFFREMGNEAVGYVRKMGEDSVEQFRMAMQAYANTFPR